MIGLTVLFAGWVCVVVACCVLFGLWTLIPAGAVMCAAGILVDWEKIRGERS